MPSCINFHKMMLFFFTFAPHQMTNWEARAIAAEELRATEGKRHDLECERLRSRIDLLEQALDGERLLAARATQQLHAELLRVKSLSESEADARATEAVVSEKLERTKKASAVVSCELTILHISKVVTSNYLNAC